MRRGHGDQFRAVVVEVEVATRGVASEGVIDGRVGDLHEALRGAADTGDGVISVNELKAYVEAKVPEVTAAHKGDAQYPVSYGYGQDFPIALR
jgi:hypothetical protein